MPAITLLNESIRSTMKNGSQSPVQFFYEAQDSFRISNDKYEGELVSLLRRKYDKEPIDLIYVLGPPALKFLLKHQSELFTELPIVFIAADYNRMADLNLGSRVTGVFGKVELSPTLDIALALQPQTQRVIVVAGKASIDNALVEQAHREFRPYEGKVEFTYLIGLSIDEIRKELSGLTERSIVFYLSVASGDAPVIYTNLEVLSLIAPSASAPIYGALQTYVGNGVIGGRLIDFEAIGTRAAETGLRILAGESPQNIPPQIVPNSTMFDWRELRRWGIRESKLPPGSIVRFKEPTLWEQYKWRIIGLISLCVFEALLIVYLFITRASRKRAEQESVRYARLAEAEHRHLDEVVSNTPGIVWESRFESGMSVRKIKFVNDYVEQMLGYSVEECLATENFWLSIIHNEDREESARKVDVILEGGQAGVQQFRCMTKDGRVRWVEAHLAAIRDEAGKPVGLRGVALDISDRMEAEEALRQSEAQFRNMADTAPVIVFIADADMLCTFFNQYVFDFTGRSNEELIGNGWLEVVHEEDRERCVNIYMTAQQARKPFIMEFRARRADGAFRWIYDTAVPRFASDGEFLGYIGTGVDITDRKDAEEALQTAHEEVNKLKNQLEAENIYLQEEIKLAHNFEEIVGHSDALKYVLYKIEQVAPTDSTVLITGETGTGKELVARAIHSASRRKDRPLVKVNCAALSASLIESELFGHERGSFTGASARKIGRFELATGATIFLDEIGELPLELQVKLLRVIQEGEFERLGSSKTIKADVRIIAATNRNLQMEVQKGLFREDLWYRLNVFPITVPPLKQRREDIPQLVEHFVKRFSKKLGKEIPSVPPATLKTLHDYSWPGNIRELANVIERAAINTQGTVLCMTDHFVMPHAEELSISTKTLEEIEREHITRTLSNTGWRIEGASGAAKVLGLNPSTLRTRMNKLGIQKPQQSLV